MWASCCCSYAWLVSRMRDISICTSQLGQLRPLLWQPKCRPAAQNQSCLRSLLG